MCATFFRNYNGFKFDGIVDVLEVYSFEEQYILEK